MAPIPPDLAAALGLPAGAAGPPQPPPMGDPAGQPILPPPNPVVQKLQEMAAHRAQHSAGPQKRPGHPQNVKPAHPHRNPPPPREGPGGGSFPGAAPPFPKRG